MAGKLTLVVFLIIWISAMTDDYNHELKSQSLWCKMVSEGSWGSSEDEYNENCNPDSGIKAKKENPSEEKHGLEPEVSQADSGDNKEVGGSHQDLRGSGEEIPGGSVSSEPTWGFRNIREGENGHNPQDGEL